MEENLADAILQQFNIHFAVIQRVFRNLWIRYQHVYNVCHKGSFVFILNLDLHLWPTEITWNYPELQLIFFLLSLVDHTCSSTKERRKWAGLVLFEHLNIIDSNSEKQNNVYSRSSIDGFKTIFLLFYTSKILQIKLHTSILHNKQHTSPQLFSLIFQATHCRFTLRLLAWLVWILDGLKTIFSLLRWGVYVMFL